MELEISRKQDLFLVRWLKRSIGFGYQPQRAVWGLFGLWLLGTVLYSHADARRAFVPNDKEAAEYVCAHQTPPDYYPRFNPMIFSLENALPLVRLGQGDKWQPASSATGMANVLRLMIWIQVVVGWLLATLFVAALSGLVQH
jgi:hypothetical protein